MRVFIQFDVELHNPLKALVQGSQAVDMFILLEVQFLHQSEVALTQTDELCVLLLADT